MSLLETPRSLPVLDFTPEVARATAPIRERVRSVIPDLEWPFHAPYIAAINELKRERNAVVLAHNYQTPEIFHGVADFAGDSLALAQYGARTEAEVIVLNVAQYAVTAAGTMGTFVMGTYGDAMLTPETQQRLAEQADEVANRTVEEAARQLERAEGRVVHGDVGPTICQVAEDEGADLVVLGTHDRSRWSRLWFGSVSDHVVRHAPCPVLVVRR